MDRQHYKEQGSRDSYHDNNDYIYDRISSVKNRESATGRLAEHENVFQKSSTMNKPFK